MQTGGEKQRHDHRERQHGARNADRTADAILHLAEVGFDKQRADLLAVVGIEDRTEQHQRITLEPITIRPGWQWRQGLILQVGGKFGPDPLVLVDASCQDLQLASEIGKGPLRVFRPVEVQRRRAVLAGDVHQRGHLRNQVRAETGPLIQQKRGARQQQRDATGQHDDRRQLALNRALLEEFHELLVLFASFNNCVSIFSLAFSAAA